MKKRTVVYRRGDGWYLHSCSQTTVGLWMAGEPHIKLSTEESPAELGHAIRRALDASRENIPHPTDFPNDNFGEMLNLAGVKSWAKFMRGAPSIDVQDDGKSLTFEPSRDEGPKVGYTPLTGKNFCIPRNSTPEGIADAVQRAIALCE